MAVKASNGPDVSLNCKLSTSMLFHIGRELTLFHDL
jgi:hypothetical protein